MNKCKKLNAIQFENNKIYVKNIKKEKEIRHKLKDKALVIHLQKYQ